MVCSRQRTRPIAVDWWRKVLRALFEGELQVCEGELSLVLLSARAMAQLNESFLRHAGTTDVITFDYTDRSKNSGSPQAALSGEIVVCVDEAIMQARRFRTSWKLELLRYAIHGGLHLLGYDDKCAHERRQMKREEDRLLAKMARKSGLSRHAEALPNR